MKVYCVIRDWWGEQPEFVSLANYDNDLRIFSTREAAEGFIKQDAHTSRHTSLPRWRTEYLKILLKDESTPQ